MSKKVKITLIKSISGRNPKHKPIVHQLGLRKINSSVVHEDIPAIRGLINKVSYLLRVEDGA